MTIKASDFKHPYVGSLRIMLGKCERCGESPDHWCHKLDYWESL